jgi:hypothetical protein
MAVMRYVQPIHTGTPDEIVEKLIADTKDGD